MTTTIVNIIATINLGPAGSHMLGELYYKDGGIWCRKARAEIDILNRYPGESTGVACTKANAKDIIKLAWGLNPSWELKFLEDWETDIAVD